MHDVRTANLLGAFALSVHDEMVAQVRARTGLGGSAAAGLVTLLTAADVTVTGLGRRVGLTQSATARMVDGLEHAGLVSRRPASSRWVGLELTGAGIAAAREVLAARAEVLREVLDDLDGPEQEIVAALLEKVLAGQYRRVGSGDRICRLCDRQGCVRGSVCPVGRAEREAIRA